MVARGDRQRSSQRNGHPRAARPRTEPGLQAVWYSLFRKCPISPALLSGEREGTSLPQMKRHYVNFHVALPCFGDFFL
ncbi:hypothetical protein VZ95_16510 [Elstera litoralis]|uniref:Uncharacterized protein n=1 Tax=Elstera litoralis TaxID=552518 RepID=A0A0F3IPJ7_9PROT|nr:hypothetical protein VZ95_16510 [Elstera litoralis]